MEQEERKKPRQDTSELAKDVNVHDAKINQLNQRMDNLESLVVRMAHNAGVSHTLIIKAGLTPFHPSAQDMGKFKRGES